VRRDIPVDPDPDQAREWLRDELGRGDAPTPASPEPPSWWQDFVDWLRRLFAGGDPGSDPDAGTGGTIGLVVAVVLVVALLVAAFAIFGLPRLRRRSRVAGDLFGEEDDRSSSAIRTEAQRAADAGDYTTAVIELFRSLARDLAERGIVLTFPGTTARDFARRTGAVFPAAADGLGEAAVVFDDLRYLGAIGTREQWERMSALDAELRRARPAAGPSAADALAAAAAGDPR
jgi:hypothetical protein